MKKIISIITILTLFLSQSQFVLAQDAPLDKETEIQQFAKEQGISKEQATIYVDYILTRKLNDYQQKLYDRASPRIKAMMEGKSSAYGSKIISLLENTAGSVLKKNIDYFIVLSSLADFTSQLNLNGFIKDFETKLDYVHYQNIPNFDSEAGISDKNILLTNPNEPDIGYNGGLSHDGCRLFELFHNTPLVTTLDEKNGDMILGDNTLNNKFTIATREASPTTLKGYNSMSPLRIDYKYKNLKPADYPSADAYLTAVNATQYLEPTMNRDELFKKENLISVSKPRFVKERIPDFNYIELVKRKDNVSQFDNAPNLYILSCSLVGER